MRVRWTRFALKDLDDIENYIALDDAGRAADFVDKLIDLGDSLEFDTLIDSIFMAASMWCCLFSCTSYSFNMNPWLFPPQTPN